MLIPTKISNDILLGILKQIMKKNLITFIVFLLTAGALSAQKPQSHNSCGGINLSIWKGIATQRVDTVSSTWLNIGLASYINRLNGLSVNVLANATRTDAIGLQVSGIANVTGESMQGIQLAGITNINGDHLRGISLSGVVNISGDKAQGLMAGGLVNISGEAMQGISLGVLLNISGNKSCGVQIGGMAQITGGNSSGISLGGLLNVTGESMNGVQMAGLLNIAGSKVNGIQLAPLGNVTGENLHGLQLSGIGNLCGGTVKGVQIAPFNASKRVTGLQIGLVNYRKDSLSRGAQLGVVNLTPRTRYQLMMGVGNNSTFDVGARFKNHRWFTILGLGTGYRHVGSKFNASVFYRAGVEYPLAGGFSLSGDLGYRHIESFSNKHHGHPKSLYALQGRLQLHYQFNPRLSLFAGSGYSQTRRYDSGTPFDKSALLEAGVVLF